VGASRQGEEDQERDGGAERRVVAVEDEAGRASHGESAGTGVKRLLRVERMAIQDALERLSFEVSQDGI